MPQKRGKRQKIPELVPNFIRSFHFFDHILNSSTRRRCRPWALSCGGAGGEAAGGPPPYPRPRSVHARVCMCFPEQFMRRLHACRSFAVVACDSRNDRPYPTGSRCYVALEAGLVFCTPAGYVLYKYVPRYGIPTVIVASAVGVARPESNGIPFHHGELSGVVRTRIGWDYCKKE